MDCWRTESKQGKTKTAARLIPTFVFALLMTGAAFPNTTGEGLLDETIPAGLPIILASTTESLTDESTMQFDPAISGDIVTLTELRNGGQNVAYVNLTTGEYVWITQGEGRKILADVGGNRIVYMDYSSGLADAFVYEIDTATRHLVTEVYGSQERPRIDGDLVVYEHRIATETRFVWLTDVATGTVTQVTDGTYQDMRPVVHDELVAFERREGTRYIMLHDLETDDQWPVAPHAGNHQEQPHLDGDLLVFDAIAPGETHRDLFLHNLSTGDTLRLDLPGDQIRGRISGGFMSYDHRQGNDGDIGLWHIPTCNLHTLPNELDDADFLNDIDGNRVVFTSDRSGSFDIWLHEFMPLPGLELLGQGDPSFCPLIDDRFKEV